MKMKPSPLLAGIFAAAVSVSAAWPSPSLSYAPQEATTVVPQTEIFACTEDGWLISMLYEIQTSGGRVAPGEIARLENLIAQSLRQEIATRSHETVTITPGGDMRRAFLDRVDPVVSEMDDRNRGTTTHIGLNDGRYVDFCPVA